MKKYQTTNDKKVAQLEEKIRNLNLELESEEGLNKVLSECCDNNEKQVTNYRQIMKYHTLILIVMTLIQNYTHTNDIGRSIQININKYLKGLTDDLLNNLTDDDAVDDDEIFLKHFWGNLLVGYHVVLYCP